VQATGYVRAGPREAPPQRLGRPGAPGGAARQAVRDAILRGWRPPRLAGVVAALVVGDQNAIDRADWDVFRATGVAHLMSISGLHMTLFAWLAAAVVGWLWRAARPSVPGVAGPSMRRCRRAAAGHRPMRCSAAGACPRSARCGCWPRWPRCGLRGAAGPGRWCGCWRRRGGGAGPVGAAAAGLLAELLWRWACCLPPTRAHRRRAGRGGRRLRALLREQTVVTLALTPLTLLLFGQASVVGLVANLLAIPWVTLVVTPLALLGVLAPPLWDAAALAVDGAGVVLAVDGRCRMPRCRWPRAPLWAGAAGVLGGVLLVLRGPGRCGCWACRCCCPCCCGSRRARRQGAFELLAADVGQGNAVLVRTAATRWCTTPGRAIRPRERRRPPGAGAAAARLGERWTCWCSATATPTTPAARRRCWPSSRRRRYCGSIEAGHELQALRPVARCEAGQRWQWDGVVLRDAAPGRLATTAGGKPNTLSCVLRISGQAGGGRCRRPQWRCWPATSSSRRSRRCMAGREPAPPTCCWCRTMAARHRPARPFWTRCAGAGAGAGRVTATALATRHRRCCSGMHERGIRGGGHAALRCRAVAV
jgi:competence protein ComEC